MLHYFSSPRRAARATLALAAGSLVVALAACTSAPASAPTGTASPSAAASPTAAEWSYDGANGPEHWGAFGAACENTSTSLESPIAIDTDTVVRPRTSSPVVPAYQPAGFAVENNGHTVEAVPVDPQQNSVVFEGRRYFLQQFHFHATSEHVVDDRSAPAELHLVHASPDGDLLVLGVFVEVGEASAALTELLDSVPDEPAEEAEPLERAIDPTLLLPTGRVSVQYDGSLTTPPCSEGVQWNVYLDPITVTADQLEQFTDLYPNDHRPVQPLHGRTLTLVGDSAR